MSARVTADHFKGIEGKFTPDAPLGAQSWFRCGGNADLLFQPKDIDDLSSFLKQLPDDAPLHIVGGMANMIIRDGGLGEVKRISRDDLIMSYRHTDIAKGEIVLSALMRGVAEDYDTVKARMNEIKLKRNETQPIREQTGGSTYANPSAAELRKAGLAEGTRAWQIVEKVGGRGLTIGGAQMSEKHCNFMINKGGATAHDLEFLGDEIRTHILC